MKKIKTIEQLQQQKKLLKQREKEAAAKVQASWSELKTGMQPGNIAKSLLNAVIPFSDKKDDSKYPVIVQALLSFGTGFLLKKIMGYAEKKMGKYFK